ncbi:filamentous hemagglutinin N-terminal domain-containing protein, partial [Dapis sp. BLCC M126]|uniref:two-partner secretion domain-containing protein n=1 Tax=Dapis sp. BLCC M126 TaxID=3400189 RepID=UPI003CF915F2
MKPTFVESYSITALTLILGTLAPTPANSQPITPANDGTNTTVTPEGNEFNIEGGTRSGANLFHSFDKFNVNSGQTANFFTTPDTSNILGRVTGGNASYINGLIQVIGGNSNLFLINPAGIMFGPNASLNIPASFSVTTATGIGFDNNNFWFKAMGTNDYSNLVGNPSGYRFNVSTPGAIVNEGNLTLNSGENLTLLGGTVINTGELSTTNGNITIAAVDGGSVLRISQPGHLLSLEVDSRIEDISNLDTLSLPELLTGGEENNATSIIVNNNGELELTDNTIIADTPGNVFVSGNIDLSTTSTQDSESNFIVLANNNITFNEKIETGSSIELKAGRSININADIDTSVGNGNIDLLGNNDEMNITNRSDGKADINQLDGTMLNAGSGTINIELGNLGEVGDINLANLTTTGQVLVNANGGNITGVYDNSIINAGSALFQTKDSGGIGLIDAPLELNVENLEAKAISGGIFFNLLADVNVGRVSEEVVGISTIGGGDITLETKGEITVVENISTDLFVDGGTGGDLNITAKNLVIDGAWVSANTWAKGNSGSVNIRVEETIVIDGLLSAENTIVIDGVLSVEETTVIDRLLSDDLPSGVLSIIQPTGEGNAGNVNITTGSLEVANGGLISASILGKGNAGSVIITAKDTINFDGKNSGTFPSGAYSTVQPTGEGNAGGVIISTGSLEVKNGAQISSDTFGIGNAGSVKINATETVVFDGGNSEIFTGAASQVNPEADGNGGNVTITAGSIEVKNGAQISTSTFNTGDAGSVKINATETVVFDGEDSEIFTGAASQVSSGADGNGGNVTITAGSIEVKNGAQISANTNGKGDAGSVEVHVTDALVFDGGDSEIITGVTTSVRSEAEGDAGDVTITTTSLEVTNGAAISASTNGKGDAGSIDITAEDSVVLDGISPDDIPSRIVSSVGEGSEGNAVGVNITAGSLAVTNGAQIGSSTFGIGNAGRVNIIVEDSVVVNGLGVEFLGIGGGIFSTVGLEDAEGKAGGINITTDSLAVTKGAVISSSTFGKGDAASIDIRAKDRVVFDENLVVSDVRSGATGNSGSINITTSFLEVTNGSQIGVGNFGDKGNAGDVNITAENTIVFDGVDKFGFSSGVFSRIETGTEGNPGDVIIKAGSLILTNGAQIDSSTRGQGNAGSIEITAEDSIVFDGVSPDGLRSSGILSQVASEAKGKGGNVKITTDSLTVTNGAQINSSTQGTGTAGNINIEADDTIVFDGVSLNGTSSGAASIVESGAKGNAGDVSITTGSLEVTNGAQINASTQGTGNAGDIDITAENTIVFDGVNLSDGLSGGALSVVLPGAEGKAGDIKITTGSLVAKDGARIIVRTGGKGDAGSIDIIAQDSVVFDGASPDGRPNSGAFSTVAETGEGKAGSVTITTGSLEATNSGQISASTFGKGNAGSVNITAKDFIVFDGEFSNGFNSGAFSEVRGEGDAGGVTITTGSLTVTNGALIGASTFSNGNAGSINITAEDIVFDGVDSNGFSSVALSEVVQGANGNAGGVTITTGSLTLTNGAFISASTFGNGNAGSVEINATETVVLDGTNSEFFAGLDSSVQRGAEGNAGGVTITTRSLEVKNAAQIAASTFAKGDAGNINIIAEETVIFDGVTDDGLRRSGAFSTVQPNAEGNAGGVSITTDFLEVTNGAIISANTFGNGDAGNIFITTDTLLTLNNNAQISAFTETEGDGGNIILFSPEILNITGNGQITVSSSGAGDAGFVEIISPKITLSDGIDITAFTAGQGKAGNINLEGDQINIQPNTQILAFTENTGDGGNITVMAAEILNLEADTQLSVETNRGGKAGNIEIITPQLTIGNNAQISATVNIGATSTEPGGNITINTNQLDIAGELGIFAETESTADAGILTLSPYKDNPNLDITFTNDGFISASTSSTGNGGNINLTAPESINIKGDGNISVQTTDEGNAGTININTKNLTLSDRVAISASTEDKGNAGAINIDTQNLTLETGTSLTTETNNQGQAGNIEITTQELTIGENAQISATAREGSSNTEAGGNITINATDILISGRLGIFAETAGETPAGTLTVNPYRIDGGMGRGGEGDPSLTHPRRGIRGEFDPNLNITFTENGFISARTRSIGDGGNINIFAPENINISGEGRITVETEGSGDAGSINIETENLTIAEKTTISAATSNSGDGGRIDIIPSQTFQLEGQIITETTGEGNGGTITIKTGEMTAPNSTISAKSTAAGNAGQINIEAQNNITTGIITSEANNQTETANGGNISIISQNGEIDATKPIQSFSDQANAGDVNLQAKTDITTNTISSHGQQEGGQITITSETGNIDSSNSQFLANYSGGGDGGNVTIEAPQGNISTRDIYSFADADGGQITLKAGGDINITNNSNIISASEPPEKEGERGSGGVGRGGDIILEAGNNINTTTAKIYSGADVGNTGKVNIIADGAIETGQIDLASGFVRDRRTVNQNFTLIPLPQGEATQGVAGDITLHSNNSTIDTTAGTINSRSPDGTGNITLNARENITTGKLEASALNQNKATIGGDVSITSIQAQINATNAIETFSERGTAGNVNINAEGSVNIENILSQGTEQGGDITIDSRSENSINAQGTLNTFSTEGTAGDVTLTSPGSITINGIRSEGIEQGGTITVESEIGEINSTGGDIDSFSEQGIGGNITLSAPESVNLANVSSFGAIESGDLRIQSRTATVNTGNVTTQAPAGSSGSILINGEEVGTGDLSSIGTTSAGEINVEATDGSITTYDLEISSDGTIGDLILRAPEDITTGDIDITAGEGDVNIDIESGENQAIEDVNVNAGNDATANFTAGGDQDVGDVNVNAGNDAT